MKGPIADPDNDELRDAELSAVRRRSQAGGDNAALAFRSFIEAIALPAWLHDVETLEILAVNEALVALTRRPREALVGSKTLDLHDPSDRVEALRHLERLRVQAGAPPEPVALRLAIAGGGAQAVRISSRPAPSVRAGAHLAIAQEIAPPRRAVSDAPPRTQDAASKSDQRWRMFVEMSPLPAAIARVDPESAHAVELLVVNEALVQATGFSRDELLRARPSDLIHPDDWSELFHDNARLDEGAPPPRFDHRLWRHVRRDGSYFDVHLGSVALDFEGESARLTLLSDVSERRRVEAEIAQSEQRYRTLFEVCPIAACVYDLTTLRFLAVNDAMAQQYGYTRDELSSMSALDLVAPADAEMMLAQIEELRSGAAAPGVLHRAHVVRHRDRGGNEIDVELIEAPLLYAGERARLVLHKDVTEHKRAELELVKRARVDALRADLGAAMMADEPLPAHFERVVEAMVSHLDLDSVGVWLLDEATGDLQLVAHEGALDLATAGGRRLRFGETWIGRAAARGAPVVLSAADPSMRILEAARARELGVACVAGLPLVARGRALGVVTAGSSRPFPEDLIITLRAMAAQLTQAVSAAFAHEALRIGESLSRAILANMLSALVTLNEEGVIETANPAAIATFGYSGDELIGRPFTSLFDASPRDKIGLLARARGRVTEHKGKKKSGETFPCELRLFHLESLRGPGYAANLHDLSERYEVERLKSEFVSVVSHELRTPLTALRGSIGLLTGGVMGQLSPDVMELLHIAERNTKRLITLVNDILDLERLQKGKLELFLQPVRALTIVERSLEIVQAFADQERVRLEVSVADDIVLGDGDRLVQVLVNLLSNAVKFSPPGSAVQVSTEVEPAAVVFRVADQGRGIPLSHRRTIFERFGQVHMSDSREKGGTGLGLAISKAIIEQHDGIIGVESEEGAGSTFWFRVPRGLGAPGGERQPSS